MTSSDPVAVAHATLEAALQDPDAPRQLAAIQSLFSLFSLLARLPAASVRDAAAHATQRGGSGPNLLDESATVLALAQGLRDHLMSRFHLLLRVLHPRWMNGGERMLRAAPPFEAVKEELMAALDCGVIDFEGYAAIFIGRYGPDAKEVLPQLVDRLRTHRRDCSKAPGLTWAVYMIGGMSALVREVLLEVARGVDSCPHSRRLAKEILTMNEVEV